MSDPVFLGDVTVQQLCWAVTSVKSRKVVKTAGFEVNYTWIQNLTPLLLISCEVLGKSVTTWHFGFLAYKMGIIYVHLSHRTALKRSYL